MSPWQRLGIHRDRLFLLPTHGNFLHSLCLCGACSVDACVRKQMNREQSRT
jgi:hypothetical protein